MLGHIVVCGSADVTCTDGVLKEAILVFWTELGCVSCDWTACKYI